MFANLVNVRIDGDFEQARKGLYEQVLPRVKQMPGLVAGYWMDPREDNEGRSVVVYETEEQAKAAAQTVQVGSSPVPGVTIIAVETREVIARL